MGRPRKGVTDAERIFAQVDFGLCWEWTGYVMSPETPGKGHGRVRVDGRKVLVHRWVWEHLVGPIPAHLELDHLCRNNRCCNPDHLEPVTHRVNVLRGNAPAAHHARQTHCGQGHEFTPENTKTDSRGNRCCRTCNRGWQRNYAQRQAA